MKKLLLGLIGILSISACEGGIHLDNETTSVSAGGASSSNYNATVSIVPYNSTGSKILTSNSFQAAVTTSTSSIKQSGETNSYRISSPLTAATAQSIQTTGN